jgi:hypothetical protein
MCGKVGVGGEWAYREEEKGLAEPNNNNNNN